MQRETKMCSEHFRGVSVVWCYLWIRDARGSAQGGRGLEKTTMPDNVTLDESWSVVSYDGEDHQKDM